MKYLYFLASLGLSLSCGKVDESDKPKHQVKMENQGGEDDAKGKKEDSTRSETVDPTNASLALSSLKAYELSLFPLAVERCVPCHAESAPPLFAINDLKKSHKALTESGKVNFDSMVQSRVVERLLSDSHNCWGECSKNATQILERIKLWKALQEESKSPPKEAEIDSIEIVQTVALKVSDSIEQMVEDTSSNMIFEAEDGVFSGYLKIGSDNEASNNAFLEAEKGSVFGIGGTGEYELAVKIPRQYSIWIKIKSPSESTFPVTIDEGRSQNLFAAASSSSFSWVPLTERDSTTAFPINLETGVFKLKIRIGKIGDLVDSIAVVPGTDFDGSSTSTRKANILSYPLDQLTGVQNSRLDVEVVQYSKDSLMFKNPTLVTSKSLHLKGMHLFVNGREIPQNSTYVNIDKQVPPPGGGISESVMIVGYEKGQADDEFSFKFDEIRASEIIE